MLFDVLRILSASFFILWAIEVLIKNVNETALIKYLIVFVLLVLSQFLIAGV